MQHYFHQRRILIGITGSIAAYKTLELISTLRQLGAEVRVIMTKSAKHFVTPVSLETLSGQAVYQNLFSDPLIHIELAKWAEVILIAPASANFIAKYTYGLADDLLGSVLLATTAKVVIAPAMNQAMWAHPATQENVQKLKSRGVAFLGPAAGLQACGDVGLGRMLEVEDILELLPKYWQKQSLVGKKVLITAGATLEPLDPVRYLTNLSSGKMGYALAKSAYYQGAEVTLISGQTQLKPPAFGRLISANTAKEMQEHVFAHVQEVDLFISCAAICDFKPKNVSPHKIKKSDTTFSLELEKNPDLLANVSVLSKKPFLVGFAAETENLITNAQKKLQSKRLNMIIANQVGTNQGFNQDENEVYIITPDSTQHLPKCTKSLLADQILTILQAVF